MDKTKIIAGLVLVVAIGAIVIFKEPPAQDPDPDHAQESQQSSSPAATPDPALAGGVTDLKAEDERPGTGAVAKAGDEVTVNYRGTLLNGSEFDASYGKAPFSFHLGAGEVIKGWDKGVAGMKVGGKRKLTIPSDLGYGPKGSPPKIPGGATLVFEVELLKVNGKS